MDGNDAVWFTITVPKAIKGQGDRSTRTELARRIQYSRVAMGMGS